MVGNDIVDLSDPETRETSLHPRFDERVFSEREREMIARSANANLTRWRFWAAKESAYKRWKREDRKLVFSPIQFQVFLDTHEFPISVCYQDRRLDLEGAEQENCLHMVALEPGENRNPLIQGYQRNPGKESPQSSVRELTLGTVAGQLSRPVEEFEIVKDFDRVPVLYHRKTGSCWEVSISHHGEWVGFAAWVPQDQRW